jgi:P pilus assembly chaperone PapD
MKILNFTLFFVFVLMYQVFSQVVVTPYIVMIDEKNKFGTYTVVNETNETEEVSIAFKFEYLKSDAEGNLLYDPTETNMNSAVSWIKAFPKKFVLKPGEKQIVRMTIDPPSGLAKGTYWAKIVTSSQKQEKFIDTSGNIKARINFVLNQITTVLFKNQKYENQVDLTGVNVTVDNESVNILSSVSVKGDQPFYAQFTYKIYDAGNKVVSENTEFLGLFFDIQKKYKIPVNTLQPGNYSAEVTLGSDIGPDIPKTDKGEIQPLTKKVDFTIK